MAIKKERKPRVVKPKTLTKVQKIADEINSLVVGKYMWEKANQEQNTESMQMWREYVSAATDSLRDMGIPMGWRLAEDELRKKENLPLQQDIPFD